MDSFRSRFKNKHVILPVLHSENGMQTLNNAKIAHGEGADGVFLINHKIGYKSLFQYYIMVKENLPTDFFVGVNCLDLGMMAIEMIPLDCNGLWVDNAGVSEELGGLTSEAIAFNEVRLRIQWNGIYFGGVAFKYTGEVADVGRAAKLAVPYVDVITTSGIATGSAPDLLKIRTMKEAIGDHPLAIASGVSARNIEKFLPYADCFLVYLDKQG